MNKKILAAMALVLTLIAWHIPSARAQGSEAPLPIAGAQKQTVVDSITAGYYDWQSISLSGKLSSSMLPLSPSVKIYMERDSLIVMSVSVPLMGEAMRMEVDPRQALVVSHLNNSYITLDMEQVEALCPGGLQAMQNLLLGRVNILGAGELTPANMDLVEIYDSNPDTWVVLPVQDLENAPYVYLYTVGRTDWLLDRFMVMTADGSGEVNCAYSWSAKNLTLDFTAEMGGNPMGATLKLNNPDSKPKPISRFKLNSGYRQTDLRGLLK